MGNKMDAYHEAIESGAYKHHKEALDDRPEPTLLKSKPWYKKLNWYLVLALVFFALSVFIASNSLSVKAAFDEAMVPTEPVKVAEHTLVNLTPEVKRRQARAIRRVKKQIDSERVVNNIVNRYFNHMGQRGAAPMALKVKMTN